MRLHSLLYWIWYSWSGSTHIPYYINLSVRWNTLLRNQISSFQQVFYYNQNYTQQNNTQHIDKNYFILTQQHFPVWYLGERQWWEQHSVRWQIVLLWRFNIYQNDTQQYKTQHNESAELHKAKWHSSRGQHPTEWHIAESNSSQWHSQYLANLIRTSFFRTTLTKVLHSMLTILTRMTFIRMAHSRMTLSIVTNLVRMTFIRTTLSKIMLIRKTPQRTALSITTFYMITLTRMALNGMTLNITKHGVALYNNCSVQWRSCGVQLSAISRHVVAPFHPVIIILAKRV